VQHILILGQDQEYNNRLISLLREEGFTLSCAHTIEETADQFYSKRIDLLIVDLESWKEEGLAVYKNVRHELGGKNFSSIIITPLDLMKGIKFSLSFDDFVLKHDDPAEVLVRIKQLLWRQSKLDVGNTIRIGDLAIDLNNYAVTVAGKRVYLTYKEYELLKFLVLNRGKVFNRETLLDKVWGYDNYAGTRTVDIHIQRLRTKLGGKYIDFIQTIRNVGYTFSDDTSA